MGCCLSLNPKKAHQLPQQSQSTIQPPISRSPRDTDKSSKPIAFAPETKEKQPNTAQRPSNTVQHSQDISGFSGSWDLDEDPSDQHRREFQERMTDKKLELEHRAQTLEDLRNTTLEAQVSQQQRSDSFQSLYKIFKQCATNDDRSKMDIHGLTEALRTFGMVIDNDRNFQKLVFSKFDIENEGEIDYNDFMATMSSLIGTKDEDSLMLMFQIFDIDEDGYLNTEDIARILLAQNQIAIVVMGHRDDTTTTYTRKQCLKIARKMITKYDDNFTMDKISFDEYARMMKNMTNEKMIMENMTYQPSDSIFMD